MHLPTLLSYLPVVTYLCLVSAVLATRGRCPWQLHPLVAAAGLAARVVLDGPSWALVAGVGLAAACLVLLSVAGSGLLSATGTWTVACAVALCPLAGFPGLFGGLALAAAVAVRRISTSAGKAAVAMVTMETMAAVGVDASGTVRSPDASALMTRADGAHLRSGTVTLAYYLLAGAVVAAIAAGLWR